MRVQRQDDQAAERNPAGELGITEWDAEIPHCWECSQPLGRGGYEFINGLPFYRWLCDQHGLQQHTLLAEVSAPEYAPDMHHYIALAHAMSWAAIIIGLPLVGFLAGYIVRSLST